MIAYVRKGKDVKVGVLLSDDPLSLLEAIRQAEEIEVKDESTGNFVKVDLAGKAKTAQIAPPPEPKQPEQKSTPKAKTTKSPHKASKTQKAQK